MKKRIVGALLALVMTIGVLAGCGGPEMLDIDEDFDIYDGEKLVGDMEKGVYGNSYLNGDGEEITIIKGDKEDMGNYTYHEYSEEYQTRRGIKVGSSLEDIFNAYSGEDIVRIHISPNNYEEMLGEGELSISRYGKLKELREEYQREIKAMEEDGGDIYLTFGFYANDEEKKSLAYPNSKERGGEGGDMEKLEDEGYEMYLLDFAIEKGKVVSIVFKNAVDISD